MGIIFSCFKKEEKSNGIDELLNATGRYCFHCNTTFIDKKRYNEHLAGCDHLKSDKLIN